MNTNITDSNKFDSSKSNNNSSISPSLLNTTFGNRDVTAGSGGVNLSQKGLFVPSTIYQDTQQNIYQKNVEQLKEPITKSSDQNENLVNSNLQGGSRHDYEDDGPQPLKPMVVTTKPTGNTHIKERNYDDDGLQPLKPMGATTKPTGNEHIKERDYDDDGLQPLKPMGATTKPTGNTHIKERDYDDDGPQPLKPMGATTKPTGNTHIKERDYEDDGPQPLKPMGVTTKPTGYAHIKERDYEDDGPQPLKPMVVTTQLTGKAPPINQSEQLQKSERRSSIQDLNSGSGNKKAKSNEKARLLEEPLKPLGPQEKCCSSCVIL